MKNKSIVTNDTLKIMTELIRCRDNAKLIHRKHYPAKIKPYVKRIQKDARKFELTIFQSVVRIMDSDYMKKKGSSKILLGAAAVELLHVEAEKKANK